MEENAIQMPNLRPAGLKSATTRFETGYFHFQVEGFLSTCFLLHFVL